MRRRTAMNQLDAFEVVTPTDSFSVPVVAAGRKAKRWKGFNNPTSILNMSETNMDYYVIKLPFQRFRLIDETLVWIWLKRQVHS